MTHETNPFRLSMLQRSQSPFDEFEETIIAHPSTETENSRRSYYDVSGSSSDDSGKRQSHVSSSSSQHQRGNPFRVNLSEPPLPSTPQPTVTVTPEPPPYEESSGGRRIDSGPRANNDSKGEPAQDENYRRGLEEGMRIAKEKERRRRREMRERRHRMEGRSSGSNKDSSERHSKSTSSKSRPSVSRSSSTNDAVRHSSSRSRSKSESSRHHKPGMKPESLDVIDKMDVTGIYGSSRFHHDGPFDACAPHRNKQGVRGATPISAFPVDGPNNSLAVEDPSLASFRRAENVYGREADSVTPEMAQSSFNPLDRGAKVHGERTMGLGSTTFIDGTPASKDAIENAYKARSQNLGRSRSLFKPRSSAANDDINSGESRTLLGRVKSLRVSRH